MPRTREYVAELVGTFLMLLVGLSAVTVMFAATSPLVRWVSSEEVRRLITGALFAGGATLIVYSPIGKTSGGHLNPAVTLAMLRMGKMTQRGAAGYVAAQLAGALAGAAVVRLLWGSLADDVRVGATTPGIGGWPWSVVAEVAFTFALVGLILRFVDRPALMRFTPLAAGALVATLVFVAAPISGTSLNPARSLGPAVIAGVLDDLWIYVVAPIAGALLAVVVYRRRSRGVRCGKLVHDERYECRFLDCQYTPPSRRLPSMDEMDRVS